MATLIVCPTGGAQGKRFKAHSENSGEPVKVAVEGVRGEMLRNVLAYLSLEQQKSHPNLTDGRIQRLHKKAFDEIRSALRPFGYYQAVVEGELTKKESVWLARYRIDPGDPVKIKQLDVVIKGSGAQDEHFVELLKNLPVQEGQILEDGLYEKAKKSLQNLAARRGYLDAVLVRHEVQVSTAENRAIVHLHLDSGPQYRFGDVSITHDLFHPTFLYRFVHIKKGQPFQLAALLRLQTSLSDSDYFQHVEVRADREMAEGLEVPVIVTLEPRKRNKYTAGVGYGTDTGMRGSLGWENRRINSWGHKMQSELRLSEIKKSFTTQYMVPLENPATEYLEYLAGWHKEDTETSESETSLLGVSHIHTRGDWKETFYLNFQEERFNVGDQGGRSILLMPGISWKRIRADNRIFATRGNRVSLDLRGAHKSVVSDASFAQLRMKAKWIRGLWRSGRVILRGEGGTSMVETFSELPASVRFFAGGDQSIRGYEYNSLGPTDENGDVVGGKHLMVGSLEIEHQFYKKWSAAVFYDLGNAIDELTDPYKKGVGGGIRWRSPVGQIRVDVALGLSKDHPSWRLHLTVGPDL